jgi:hypothetical protein
MNTKELNFAYKVRYALDESVNHLPAKTVERLSFARNSALLHKKQGSSVTVLVPQAVFAGAGHAGRSLHGSLTWLSRMGLVVPLAALIFGLMGIYQFEQRQQTIDAASIDAEMLTDDLPLTAYLDNGFNAYLAKGEN